MMVVMMLWYLQNDKLMWMIIFLTRPSERPQGLEAESEGSLVKEELSPIYFYIHPLYVILTIFHLMAIITLTTTTRTTTTTIIIDHKTFDGKIAN